MLATSAAVRPCLARMDPSNDQASTDSKITAPAADVPVKEEPPMEIPVSRRIPKPDASSTIPLCFWPSEEEDVESAPRDMKLKWKRLLQKRTGSSVDEENGYQADTGEDGDSNWSDLPMELLVRVMSLVDNRTIIVASGVCTGWRELLRQGINDLSFHWCGRHVSKLVQSLAPKFSKLSSCNLIRCRFLDDWAIEAVGRHMHDLRILDLTNGTGLTDASLFALANGCVGLEKLNLSGCSGLTEIGLVSLAQSCTNLKQLNLCGCDTAASDKALLALAGNCRGLQYLNVGWCERITDVGVTALAVGCADLRVLDLCECYFITDKSVMVLADHCLQLRGLNLYMCQNITDLSMYALANKGNAHHQHGKETSDKSGSGVRDTRRSENTTSRRQQNARSNSESFVGGSTSNSRSSNSGALTSKPTSSRGHIEALVNNLDGDGLVSLNLSGCRGLSAAAVQAVCNAYPALHTCPERCSLNISGCLNLTSVHCMCVMEARREHLIRASYNTNRDPGAFGNRYP